MTYEIYINDSLIEISNPKIIGLTFQVASIFDPESRSGNLTNSFIAPFTLVNNQVLGNLLNINSDSNLPYQRNSAKIVQNGVEIVPNGFALIDEASDGYKITIYSGNVSFFDLIKDMNVSDFDLEYLDHTYNSTNQQLSWENDLEYIYPIIDWGKLDTPLLPNSPVVNTEDFLPCLKLKTIINKTLDAISYSLKGNFKDTTEFNELVITPQNFFISDAFANLINGGAYRNTLYSYTTPATADDTYVEFPLTFNYFSKPTFSGQQFQPVDSVWGRLHFSSSFFINYVDNDLYRFYTYLKVEIYEDGLLYSTSNEVIDFSPVDYFNRIMVLDMYTPYIFLNSAKVYSFKTYIKTRTFTESPLTHVPSYNSVATIKTGTTDTTPSSLVFTATGIFDVEVKRVIAYGEIVRMSLIYNVKINNIVRDISNMYNLIIQTNEVTKEVSISPLNDLTDNIPKAINWSSKIDLRKKITVKYTIGSYAQNNKLKYTDVTDVPIDSGSGIITVANTNLPSEKDLIIISSAAAETRSAINNYDVPIIPVKTTSVEISKDVKHRYFLLDRKTESLTYLLESDNTVEANISTTNLPIASFENLKFDSLITANYGTFVGMLNKIKFVAAYFQLKETDVVDIDFTIPIYLDISDGRTVVNGYFYINKISNFKVDSSTLVELIRL